MSADIRYSAGARSTRRSWIPRSLVVGVVALSGIAASLGVIQGHETAASSTSPTAFAPVTGFGGYYSKGDVTQLSAQWRVPTAANAAGPGASVTWIGAQGVGSVEPFIQLGSYSNVYQQASHAPVTSYGLFWSDTAKGFHAVGIVRLEHPGDLIQFQMTRNPAGWKLEVKNLSAKWTRSIEVHYGTGESFTHGEWIQEDPASARITSTDVPYANTSVVTFQHLRVDERVPHLEFEDALVLSTVDGTYLVPTRVRHDAFSLEPARGAARQFLADAENFDSSLYPATVLNLSASHPSARTQRTLVATMVKSYSRFGERIRTQPWPASDRAMIGRFARDNAVLALNLSQWIRSDGSTARLKRILGVNAFRSDDTQLRASLGLPPAP
jgi:Peptidase A4 family